MHETWTKDGESRWPDAGWLLFLFCLTGFYCVSEASRLSATFDEPFYLRAGLEAWHTGSTYELMRAGTMPLPIDVETGVVYAWEQLRGEPFDADRDSATILPWARAGNLVFWAILLVYTLLLGRYLGGPWAGRLAAAAVAFDPNMLAHAGLATTDIAIAAAMLAFVYHYLRTRESGWWSRVGLMAVLYGLAHLTKASAMAFCPICMVVIEAHRLAPRFWDETASLGIRRRIVWIWKATWPFRRDSVQIVLLGTVLLFAWCGSDYHTQKSFVQWADKLPEGPWRERMIWLSQNATVFPNAGVALAFQIKHNFKGHGSYILGDWFPRAVWYYFPVTLLIKLSIPALLMVALALLRPRAALQNPVALLAVAFFLFSVNARVQIGVRFMLPLVAFLLIWGSITVVRGVPSAWPVTLRRGLILGFALALAVPAALVWPNGISYGNQLWGGTSQVYKYLGDSSFDWGQGLLELNEWQERHPEAPLRIWYFGMDPISKRPPFDRVDLHSMDLKDPSEVDALLKGKYLAVSASLLFCNPHLSPSGEVALENLKQKRPIDRTMTFFIFSYR